MKKVAGVGDDRVEVGFAVVTYGGVDPPKNEPCHVDDVATKGGCMVGWNNGDSNSLNFSHNNVVQKY